MAETAFLRIARSCHVGLSILLRFFALPITVDIKKSDYKGNIKTTNEQRNMLKFCEFAVFKHLDALSNRKNI
jgi:hypothetical protein